MRFVTYIDQTSEATHRDPKKNGRMGLHVGPLGDGTLIDLHSGLEWMYGAPEIPAKKESGFPEDMVELISRQNVYLPLCQQLIELHETGKLSNSLTLSEKDATLLSPVPRPTSMRDGYAFRQHVEAARRNRGVPMLPEFDEFPVFYFTNHLAVTGPGKVKVRKNAQEKLDYELEAAIVVGKEGMDIPAAKADEYIFGYTIMNDWSARALQMQEMKLNLGPAKGKDFATSLGPYLVTRDELAPKAIKGKEGERHDLKMKAWVNGKQLSEGNMKDITWTFAQILERVSYGVKIEPGEVIGSGTVGTGCLLELNGSKITDNLWIKPGDKVVLEIEGLGRLENEIVSAD